MQGSLSAHKSEKITITMPGCALCNKSKPKRKLNAYMVFANENREAVLADNPGMAVTEVAKVLGGMWRALREDEKEQYKR